MTTKKETQATTRDGHSHWWSSIKWPPLKHTQTAKNGLSGLYIYTSIHIHVCNTNNKKKEAKKLRGRS